MLERNPVDLMDSVLWQVELTQGPQSCFLVGSPSGRRRHCRLSQREAAPMCPVSAAAVKPGFAALGKGWSLTARLCPGLGGHFRVGLVL